MKLKRRVTENDGREGQTDSGIWLGSKLFTVILSSRSDDEFDENSVEAQQASIDRSPRVPEQMKRGLSDIMALGEAGNGDAKVSASLARLSFPDS